MKGTDHKFVSDLVDVVRQAEVGQRVEEVQAVPRPLAQLAELLLVAVDVAHGPTLAVDVGEQRAAGLVPDKKNPDSYFRGNLT